MAECSLKNAERFIITYAKILLMILFLCLLLVIALIFFQREIFGNTRNNQPSPKEISLDLNWLSLQANVKSRFYPFLFQNSNGFVASEPIELVEKGPYTVEQNFIELRTLSEQQCLFKLQIKTNTNRLSEGNLNDSVKMVNWPRINELKKETPELKIERRMTRFANQKLKAFNKRDGTGGFLARSQAFSEFSIKDLINGARTPRKFGSLFLGPLNRESEITIDLNEQKLGRLQKTNIPGPHSWCIEQMGVFDGYHFPPAIYIEENFHVYDPHFEVFSYYNYHSRIERNGREIIRFIHKNSSQEYAPCDPCLSETKFDEICKLKRKYQLQKVNWKIEGEPFVFLSRPHFLGTPIPHNIQGLKSNEDSHASIIEVDLLTGQVVRIIRRYQLNLFIPETDDVEFSGVCNRIIPLFWFEQEYDVKPWKEIYGNV